MPARLSAAVRNREMTQIKIKRIGIVSIGWLFAIFWFFIYLVPLCANQFWGKDGDVTITCPFMEIQPASFLAITSLIVLAPLFGFITGVLTALCTNLVLWLCGGITLNVEIETSEPGDTPNSLSSSAPSVCPSSDPVSVQKTPRQPVARATRATGWRDWF